ncbi:MAG: type II secretion system protein M [Cellvibrionaceae bacterium]|nr:type II secretion system protein M [Cellvibrionaceae bacterium]
MDRLKLYWQQCQLREQIFVATAAVVLTCFLVFLLIINPLLNWRGDEQRRFQQSQRDLLEVNNLVAQLKAKDAAAPPNTSQPRLSVVIDRSLQENSLVMRGFQPGGNQDARLRLENAAYPDLAQWLYDLEYRHSIYVQELSLTPAKASGRLMVTLRVSR